MNEHRVSELSQNQRSRLEFIEFLVRFKGELSRTDLINYLGIAGAAATRDIKHYRELAPHNLLLNSSSKKYEIVEESFVPVFNIEGKGAISRLRKNSNLQILGLSHFDGVVAPSRFFVPETNLVSKLVRAMSLNKKLTVKYHSLSSGASKKSLFPVAMFDGGVNWYLRAYDFDKSEYRDLKLSRFSDAIVEQPESKAAEIRSSDYQWNRVVSLELAPHPNRLNVANPDSIVYEYRMKDGYLKTSVRAVVAGYWLKHWNVDCTEKAVLKGYEYQLWLKNNMALYDVDSRKIAPGLSGYPDSLFVIRYSLFVIRYSLRRFGLKPHPTPLALRSSLIVVAGL